MKRIKEAQVLEVIDQLSNFAAQQKNDELRGIASIGKKNFNRDRPKMALVLIQT